MSNRILIVDDDQSNIDLLIANLKEVSDEIHGVTDSTRAEEAVTEFKPDLVLLDLHMPHPDGLELLRTLRCARETAGYLPVIVLTADISKVARNSALILGADDFLTKPFDRWEVKHSRSERRPSSRPVRNSSMFWPTFSALATMSVA